MVTSTYVIREIVIEYRREDLLSWKGGDKRRWLTGPVPSHVANQPPYHFAEYYVLHHFRKALWQGHRFYALGDWEPDNDKYAEGRKAIAQRFTADQLAKFKSLHKDADRGVGEPDLFLYMENGPNLFLEVKKGRDRTAAAQLTCLAQIRATLHAEVGVVYVAEYGKKYKPRTYVLNLESFTGEMKHDT